MRRCILLVELLNRHDFYLRLRHATKHVGEFGIHLIGVLPVEIQNLLPRMRVQFRIGGDCRIEALQILESQLLRHAQHSPFNFLHLRQADLVNLVRRQIRGRALFDSKVIPRYAFRQGPDAGIQSALRRVVIFHKRSEL